MAELFGNSRSQQLAAGKPSDVLARCWILESAERDRSLNLLGKGAAFHLCAPFPRAREGGASASGVSIRRRRRAAMGTVRREPIETAGRGVAVAGVRSGISGWVIGLLIRGRAGAERRAANPGRRVLADGEARRRFLFGTWRSAVAELFGNSRSQQLAGGKPSDVLARCWILESAERDRSLNLLGKGAAFHLGAPFPRAREGGASASGVSIRRRRRAAMGTVRREPIETAGRGVAVAGVRSGISGWVIGLLIRGRAGAERRAANPGRRVLADVEARRRFLFGTWRSAVAELFGNSRSQQLAGGKPSDVLARCWILELAERDRSLNLLGKGAAFHLGAPFPRAREGGASASGVSIRRRRRAAMGTVRREPIETAGRGVCGGCALRHFRRSGP